MGKAQVLLVVVLLMVAVRGRRCRMVVEGVGDLAPLKAEDAPNAAPGPSPSASVFNEAKETTISWADWAYDKTIGKLKGHHNKDKEAEAAQAPDNKDDEDADAPALGPDRMEAMKEKASEMASEAKEGAKDAASSVEEAAKDARDKVAGKASEAEKSVSEAAESPKD